MIQFGLPAMKDIANHQILTYMSVLWSDADLHAVKVTRGDPAGQARLEALALLTAPNTWAKLIADAQGRLVIRGDALEFLFDVLRFRARDPVLNDLAGEMALLTAPWGVDLRAIHVWSEKNEVCDELSRLARGERHQIRQLRLIPETRPVRVVPTLFAVEHW